MTAQGPVIPDSWRRRVQADLAASGCPEAEGEVLGYTVIVHGVIAEMGSREWAEAEASHWLSCNAVVAELRAVTTGDEIRAAQRQAADELTALTEELGLYDDGREP